MLQKEYRYGRVRFWLLTIAAVIQLIFLCGCSKSFSLGPTSSYSVSRGGRFRTCNLQLNLESLGLMTSVDNASSTPERTVTVIQPPPWNPGIQMKKKNGINSVGSFPNATTGSVSVTSMNLLAPFYHALSAAKLVDVNEDEVNEDDNSKDESTNTKIDFIDGEQQYDKFLAQDRIERVPMSIRMAKQTNADILCLQEIEGTSTTAPLTTTEITSPGSGSINKGLEARLESLLARNELYHHVSREGVEKELFVKGYDSYVWTPLMPNNKRGDIVGLCVAWRSHRHSLVVWEGFKRGMVCQFKEVCDDQTAIGSTFTLANLHLPARPSNILGRLKTMSRTVQKLAAIENNHRPNSASAPLNGLVMVAGDFNSDQNSVAAQFLKRGSSPYGNLRDRNYKAKVTKASALEMRHHYRFQDVYDATLGEDRTISIREKYAPITVSLTGRGPGCMDHIFFAVSSIKRSNPSGSIGAVSLPFHGKFERSTDSSKRRHRRKKAESRQKLFGQGGGTTSSSYVRVCSLLATIGDCDQERLEAISQGLPNCGFPSDHLPVGAMFVGRDTTGKDSNGSIILQSDEAKDAKPNESSSGISMATRRRRESSRVSIRLRRRHNVILNLVTEWLIGRGLTDVIRDQPLYKNPLLAASGVSETLDRKSRAPDLMGIVFNGGKDCEGKSMNFSPSLLIIEIAVAADPSRVRAQKLSKYQDLVDAVSNYPALETFSACHLFALVVHESGSLPDETIDDVKRLLSLTTSDPQAENADEGLESFCSQLVEAVSNFNKA
ncbi:hypothetical protein IV203_026984 [Nitzschia inconspicua]|uniref:Endonuclease/exonuclease/phosphatase domain-containing protein n=1 Tax=Nitzschia inconspicua TaxID=303405 RepID=A0A9K3LK87_9STRA|nr:hypothetical protein IV203_026984 [Nitzschia inconspicua]